MNEEEQKTLKDLSLRVKSLEADYDTSRAWAIGVCWVVGLLIISGSALIAWGTYQGGETERVMAANGYSQQPLPGMVGWYWVKKP